MRIELVERWVERRYSLPFSSFQSRVSLVPRSMSNQDTGCPDAGIRKDTIVKV